jgi:putative transposase
MDRCLRFRPNAPASCWRSSPTGKRIWRCMKTNVKDFEHEHLFFVTSTVLNWINLFDRKRFAQVVIDSLKFITEEQWINVYAFVLMPNHIHLLIKFLLNHTADQVFRDFHKYTAQQILKIMRNEKSVLINKFIVNKKDRKHQIWQRDPEFKNVYSAQFLLQKAEYIHNNPLQPKWRLVESPEDYLYSSAAYYLKDEPFTLFKLTDLRKLV